MNLSPELILSIYTRLCEPGRTEFFPDGLWRQVKERGWAYRSDLEDLGIAMDQRLYGFDFLSLAIALELPIRYICRRPRFISADSLYLEALSIVDTAALFIFLQESGFEVSPEEMVDDVLPGVRNLEHMTMADVTVFQYARSQDRRRLSLRSTERPPPNEHMHAHHYRTSTGYKVEVQLSGDTPIFISIRGPKWRRERQRVDVTCPLCGMRYEKGDPESAVSHRSFHARVMRLLSPRPSKDMLARQRDELSPEMVTQDSPLWMHRAMYERAWAFKREFSYDFIQWNFSKTRAQRERGAIGFLFTSETGVIDGACAFRKDDDEWSMEWIWIRPERRRAGLLAARWASLLALFGDFWIAHPISDAMAGFIAKHSTPQQKAKSAERIRGNEAR